MLAAKVVLTSLPARAGRLPLRLPCGLHRPGSKLRNAMHHSGGGAHGGANGGVLRSRFGERRRLAWRHRKPDLRNSASLPFRPSSESLSHSKRHTLFSIGINSIRESAAAKLSIALCLPSASRASCGPWPCPGSAVSTHQRSSPRVSKSRNPPPHHPHCINPIVLQRVPPPPPP